MLKGLLAISGHSGLFKMITESKNSIIVESLETGKRMPTYSTSKVSALEDIAIYTETEDVPLKDVFKAINDLEDGGKTAVTHKSDSSQLKDYFETVLPAYDKDRVYVSDIKKVILWYNILHEKNLLDFTEEPEEEDKEQNGDEENNSGSE